MRRWLPDLLLLPLGLAVMCLLLYLGAVSQGWVALLSFLSAAVVYHTWYARLLHVARRFLKDAPPDSEDDADDQPFFPG